MALSSLIRLHLLVMGLVSSSHQAQQPGQGAWWEPCVQKTTESLNQRLSQVGRDPIGINRPNFWLYIHTERGAAAPHSSTKTTGELVGVARKSHLLRKKILWRFVYKQEYYGVHSPLGLVGVRLSSCTVLRPQNSP